MTSFLIGGAIGFIGGLLASYTRGYGKGLSDGRELGRALGSMEESDKARPSLAVFIEADAELPNTIVVRSTESSKISTILMQDPINKKLYRRSEDIFPNNYLFMNGFYDLKAKELLDEGTKE